MATRTELRTRSRIRADQSNSTFPDDTSYNYWLDEAAKEAWYDLVHAGWPVNFSSYEAVATGQVTTLSVGSTIAMTRGVFRKDGNGYTEMTRIPEGQRAGLISPSGATTPQYYDVRIDATLGPVLELLPFASGVTFRVDWVAEYPGFANDAAVWYGPARSDELIILSTAAKGLKQEGDKAGAADLLQERAALFEKVIEMASWFDARNPAKIRDVYSGQRSPDPFAYQVSVIDGL